MGIPQKHHLHEIPVLNVFDIIKVFDTMQVLNGILQITLNQVNMAKRKNLEDVYYPVPQSYNFTQSEKPNVNEGVIKRIIQVTVKEPIV
ncbi:hypothetical protein BN1013_00702 [Candidatus Rubidus massiliensis]|nr:hypothetical protein BN1013_00702 [Candidatus Rubidus massiliensis]